MSEITQWMIQNRIGHNVIQAQNIYKGLKLEGMTYDEQVERVILYRKWCPKTDKKNQVPTKQAFDLAIAGIDPADVITRQMEFEQEPEPDNMVQVSRDMAIDAGDRNLEGQWIQW